MFYPGQYMPLGVAPGTPATAVRSGAMISAYLAKEMRNFQDGFYIVLSENVQPCTNRRQLVRLYWHIGPDGTLPMVRELVSRFNRFQVPFRFKCLAYPELYTRFDAAVLFVGRRQWDITALLVKELCGKLKEHLRRRCRCSPGVSRRDFRLLRSRLGRQLRHVAVSGSIAQGVWNAYQRGLQTESARMEEISLAFGRAGISPERPWLDPDPWISTMFASTEPAAVRRRAPGSRSDRRAARPRRGARRPPRSLARRSDGARQ